MTNANVEQTSFVRKDSGCSVSDHNNAKKVEESQSIGDMIGKIESLIDFMRGQDAQINKLKKENRNQKKELGSQKEKINYLEKENDEKDRLIAELKLKIFDLERKNDVLKRSSIGYQYSEEQDIE